VRPVWFFVLTAAVFVPMIAAAFLSGEPVYAIPVALVGLIVLVHWVFSQLLARQAMARHGGSAEAAMSDADDAVPSAPFIADEDTALGDTSQAHGEINAHDFPKGSPERAEVEHLAAGTGGTTGGQTRPEDRDGRLDKQQGKAEGYPADEPASAPRGRS
jgi:hypothetical protein